MEDEGVFAGEGLFPEPRPPACSRKEVVREFKSLDLELF